MNNYRIKGYIYILYTFDTVFWTRPGVKNFNLENLMLFGSLGISALIFFKLENSRKYRKFLRTKIAASRLTKIVNP